MSKLLKWFRLKADLPASLMLTASLNLINQAQHLTCHKRCSGLQTKVAIVVFVLVFKHIEVTPSLWSFGVHFITLVSIYQGVYWSVPQCPCNLIVTKHEPHHLIKEDKVLSMMDTSKNHTDHYCHHHLYRHHYSLHIHNSSAPVT